eukprot:MONOS_10991.1-p1 / transcript=MONOS_10991.1 / gene=MONOS_10991 / organism=Monocercomonoides_exilis_PA203 / gene_product=unspecified product / transcript_product=unspecified product / location=Mono_scaffold00526:40-7906(-) / protein_length=2530 / sequence_SO=supercontig / SO=protein_coding / is_pseudo=false
MEPVDAMYSCTGEKYWNHDQEDYPIMNKNEKEEFDEEEEEEEEEEGDEEEEEEEEGGEDEEGEADEEEIENEEENLEEEDDENGDESEKCDNGEEEDETKRKNTSKDDESNFKSEKEESQREDQQSKENASLSHIHSASSDSIYYPSIGSSSGPSCISEEDKAEIDQIASQKGKSIFTDANEWMKEAALITICLEAAKLIEHRLLNTNEKIARKENKKSGCCRVSLKTWMDNHSENKDPVLQFCGGLCPFLPASFAEEIDKSAKIISYALEMQKGLTGNEETETETKSEDSTVVKSELTNKSDSQIGNGNKLSSFEEKAKKEHDVERSDQSEHSFDIVIRNNDPNNTQFGASSNRTSELLSADPQLLLKVLRMLSSPAASLQHSETSTLLSSGNCKFSDSQQTYHFAFKRRIFEPLSEFVAGMMASDNASDEQEEQPILDITSTEEVVPLPLNQHDESEQEGVFKHHIEDSTNAVEGGSKEASDENSDEFSTIDEKLGVTIKKLLLDDTQKQNGSSQEPVQMDDATLQSELLSLIQLWRERMKKHSDNLSEEVNCENDAKNEVSENSDNDNKKDINKKECSLSSRNSDECLETEQEEREMWCIVASIISKRARNHLVGCLLMNSFSEESFSIEEATNVTQSSLQDSTQQHNLFTPIYIQHTADSIPIVRGTSISAASPQAPFYRSKMNVFIVQLAWLILIEGEKKMMSLRSERIKKNIQSQNGTENKDGLSTPRRNNVCENEILATPAPSFSSSFLSSSLSISPPAFSPTSFSSTSFVPSTLASSYVFSSFAQSIPSTPVSASPAASFSQFSSFVNHCQTFTEHSAFLSSSFSSSSLTPSRLAPQADSSAVPSSASAERRKKLLLSVERDLFIRCVCLMCNIQLPPRCFPRIFLFKPKSSLISASSDTCLALTGSGSSFVWQNGQQLQHPSAFYASSDAELDFGLAEMFKHSSLLFSNPSSFLSTLFGKAEPQPSSSSPLVPPFFVKALSVAEDIIKRWKVATKKQTVVFLSITEAKLVIVLSRLMAEQNALKETQADSLFVSQMSNGEKKEEGKVNDTPETPRNTLQSDASRDALISYAGPGNSVLQDNEEKEKKLKKDMLALTKNIRQFVLMKTKREKELRDYLDKLGQAEDSKTQNRSIEESDHLLSQFGKTPSFLSLPQEAIEKLSSSFSVAQTDFSAILSKSQSFAVFLSSVLPPFASSVNQLIRFSPTDTLSLSQLMCLLSLHSLSHISECLTDNTNTSQSAKLSNSYLQHLPFPTQQFLLMILSHFLSLPVAVVSTAPTSLLIHRILCHVNVNNISLISSKAEIGDNKQSTNAQIFNSSANASKEIDLTPSLLYSAQVVILLSSLLLLIRPMTREEVAEVLVDCVVIGSKVLMMKEEEGKELESRSAASSDGGSSKNQQSFEHDSLKDSSYSTENIPQPLQHQSRSENSTAKLVSSASQEQDVLSTPIQPRGTSFPVSFSDSNSLHSTSATSSPPWNHSLDSAGSVSSLAFISFSHLLPSLFSISECSLVSLLLRSYKLSSSLLSSFISLCDAPHIIHNIVLSSYSSIVLLSSVFSQNLSAPTADRAAFLSAVLSPTNSAWSLFASIFISRLSSSSPFDSFIIEDADDADAEIASDSTKLSASSQNDSSLMRSPEPNPVRASYRSHRDRQRVHSIVNPSFASSPLRFTSELASRVQSDPTSSPTQSPLTSPDSSSLASPPNSSYFSHQHKASEASPVLIQTSSGAASRGVPLHGNSGNNGNASAQSLSEQFMPSLKSINSSVVHADSAVFTFSFENRLNRITVIDEESEQTDELERQRRESNARNEKVLEKYQQKMLSLIHHYLRSPGVSVLHTLALLLYAPIWSEAMIQSFDSCPSLLQKSSLGIAGYLDIPEIVWRPFRSTAALTQSSLKSYSPNITSLFSLPPSFDTAWMPFQPIGFNDPSFISSFFFPTSPPSFYCQTGSDRQEPNLSAPISYVVPTQSSNEIHAQSTISLRFELLSFALHVLLLHHSMIRSMELQLLSPDSSSLFLPNIKFDGCVEEESNISSSPSASNDCLLLSSRILPSALKCVTPSFPSSSLSLLRSFLSLFRCICDECCACNQATLLVFHLALLIRCSARISKSPWDCVMSSSILKEMTTIVLQRLNVMNKLMLLETLQLNIEQLSNIKNEMGNEENNEFWINSSNRNVTTVTLNTTVIDSIFAFVAKEKSKLQLQLRNKIACQFHELNENMDVSPKDINTPLHTSQTPTPTDSVKVQRNVPSNERKENTASQQTTLKALSSSRNLPSQFLNMNPTIQLIDKLMKSGSQIQYAFQQMHRAWKFVQIAHDTQFVRLASLLQEMNSQQVQELLNNSQCNEDGKAKKDSLNAAFSKRNGVNDMSREGNETEDHETLYKQLFESAYLSEKLLSASSSSNVLESLQSSQVFNEHKKSNTNLIASSDLLEDPGARIHIFRRMAFLVAAAECFLSAASHFSNSRLISLSATARQLAQQTLFFIKYPKICWANNDESPESNKADLPPAQMLSSLHNLQDILSFDLNQALKDA